MADARKHIEKAEKYIQKGKTADALEEYKLALQDDPSNDSTVEIIAELYVKQKDSKSALDCYQYLFNKRVEEKDGPAAVLMYRKMARLGMADPENMLVCAGFLAQQKPAEARDLYKTSAKQLLERGTKDKALEALHGLSKLEDTEETHFRVGELAESLGKKEPAAKAFARAAELLRSGAATTEDRDRAVSLLERAHGLVAEDSRITLALAGAALETGKAARAAELLRPLPAKEFPERNRLLAEAYLADGKFPESEDVLWSVTPVPPESQDLLWRVFEGYLGTGKGEVAVNGLRRLKQVMSSGKKDKEFMAGTEGLDKKNPRSAELLDFLASLYREMNRDSQFGETLARIFDLHAETGDYGKAASALERMVDVSPEDPANQKRLEEIKGKVDEETYRRLHTFLHPGAAAPGGAPGKAHGPAPGGSLDDMIAQAELLTVVGQPEQALEYLKGIARLFPGEETRNERLRALFADAGLAPKPAAAPAAASAATPRKAAAVAAPPEQEEATCDITRVSEITRNIHRQASAKAVVSTSVNEIGKTWQASRCLVGLCTLGQQPTTALEYCATGIKAGDGASLAKLITTLVHGTSDGNTLALEDAAAASQLAEIAPVVKPLGIQSLLALPLMDADNTTGVMVLQQCERKRRWNANDIALLKTIVDSIVLALSHVKLRSLMRAVADEGSGLLHRTSYLDCLVSEAGRAEKQNTPWSVALLNFGRGLQPLQQAEEHIQKFMQAAAEALVGHLRQNDVGVRYDTTTLALVMPGTKGKDSFVVVDRLRKAVGAIRVDERDALPLTVGIAEAAQAGAMDAVDTVTELINRLEAALEAARKEDGHVKMLPAPALTAG